MEPKRLVFQITVENPQLICDLLSAGSGLSKLKVKKAMASGAVWRHRPGQKKHRIRRAKSIARHDETLYIYYDEEILNQIAPKAHCLKDLIYYSIWYKPPGLMTHGTRFGDHCALSRQVEQYFDPQRDAFIVHRLDREVLGLVIIAHTSKAAARISALLRRHRIDKQYHVKVLGDLCSHGSTGTIDFDIDGKAAKTHYQTIDYDPEANRSTLCVTIETGYRHQIRRHLDMLGYPVIGDPRYGKGNKNRSGIQLSAYAITFQCPYGNGRIQVAIPYDGLDYRIGNPFPDPFNDQCNK